MRERWMIRRTKTLISDQLPQKDEKVVFCKLSELQLSVYKALLESDDMQLILKQKDICDCGSQLIRIKCCYKYNPDGEKVKALTMTFMSLLIKVANHIALLTPDINMSNKQRQRAQKYCNIAFARHPQFVRLSREARFCTLSDPSYCGKMQILQKLLGVFKHEGSKVLLFSYYTQLLNIIEMYLKTTHYEYRRLDGKTAMQDRQRYVHEFNTDAGIFLFLISTKAGGLGLNLTGANVVIIFDPNWNPTYDLQAQDRAYRIGQHRDVRVYRLVSTGSIEENMYLRQIYKQQLASAAVTSENPMRYFTAVAGDAKQQGELFGLQNMFAFRADTSCLTKDLIQRHVKTEEGITMAKYIPPVPTSRDTEQQSHTSNMDEVAVSDVADSDRADSDSYHSNHNITTNDDGDMNIHDDHGVSSQILSDSDSISDDDDDDYNLIKQPLPDNNCQNYSRRKGTTKPHHDRDSGGTKLTFQIRRFKEEMTSESNSEEDAIGDCQRRVRGKAILHKDGRIERRVKGFPLNNDTMNHSGRDQRQKVIKGSKKYIIPTRHDRRMSKSTIPHGRDQSPHKLGNDDAVNDIFKECGVDFIHSNLKIVGGSRIEDHVSNIAVRDVYELCQNSQQPANYNVPTLQESIQETSSQKSHTSSQSNKALHESLLGQSQQASLKMNGTTVLFGQTPRGIRRHHFEEMAKILNHSSSSDFASYILSLPQENFSVLLKDYYSTKHPGLDLAPLYDTLTSVPDDQVKPTTKNSKATDRTNTLSARNPRVKKGATRGKESRNPAKNPKKVMTRSKGSKICQYESQSEEEGDQCERNTTIRNDIMVNKTVGNKEQTLDEERVKPREIQVSKNVHKKTSVEMKNRSKPDKRELQHHVPCHVEDSADNCLAIDKPNKDNICEQCQAHDKCSCGRQRRSSSGSSDNKDSNSTSFILHKEENLSFLDDIFIPDQSKKPPKPPPKNKSPRIQKKTTICVLSGDSSDCDIKMEDFTDIESSKMWSLEFESHKDSLDSPGTLWKRNSKFTTRQSLLEQASIEAKLENRSVYEKYAESFVQNERFHKRDLTKEPQAMNVEETLTTEDDCTVELRPSMSCIAETSSF